MGAVPSSSRVGTGSLVEAMRPEVSLLTQACRVRAVRGLKRRSQHVRKRACDARFRPSGLVAACTWGEMRLSWTSSAL